MEKSKRIFIDYDEAENAEIIASIINLDVASFEHKLALKVRTYALNSNRRLKNGAVKQLLLETYQKRIENLTKLLEKNNCINGQDK